MSLNTQMGHLYHDGNISNAFTVLDAHEKMKTREINAREAKTFAKYSGVIDRAKRVCKRRNEWEQSSVRKDLRSINSKTPSLANSLRRQSEMMFMQSSRGTRSGSDKTGSSFADGTEKLRAGDPKKAINISSWSVYSHLINADKNGVNGQIENRTKTAPCSSYRSWKYKDSRSSAKTENLVKRADQVTRTLHTLYTKSLERKWKEKGMTVLDILNRNSKEELQKALFVLRGTPTGEAIEGILKDREHVSKATSETYVLDKAVDENDDMLKLSDNVFVTPFGETVVKPRSEDKNSSRTSSDKCSNSSPRGSKLHSASDGEGCSGLNVQDVMLLGGATRPDNNDMSTNNWTDVENPITVKEVFQRDDSFLLSSMLANPSEADTTSTNHKWRDIFKAPELWKQGAADNKEVAKIKPVSIVTLTGKYRQTMLK